jgi:MYXO-CTERM domain-containing protein
MFGRCSVTAISALLSALGCADLPSTPPPAETHLAASFPTHASRVLHADAPFTATPAGFTLTTPRLSPYRLTPTLPRRAEGPIELQLGTFGIRVRELGAAGEGSLAGSAVAYPRAGGTSFWSATTEGVEEWLHLEAGATQTTQLAAAWEIEGGSLRQAGSAIMVLDEAGAPRIRVTAPEAVAASGRALTPWLTVEGARIELWVDSDGEEVLVDPVWEPAGTMTTPRDDAVATVLPGGDVLVTGGLYAGLCLTNVERYDPVSGAWSPLAPMTLGRSAHTATLLPNGQVFVAGGRINGSSFSETNTAALYYPPGDLWVLAAPPPMNARRRNHTATLLPDGRILVVGGRYGVNNLANTEVYDPIAKVWTVLPPLSQKRSFHTATLLPNGKVLVAGGDDYVATAITEIFDPTSNTWSLAAPMNGARSTHTATLLKDGTVLVAGGWQGGVMLGSAERYDWTTDSWSPAGVMSFGRAWYTATLLPDGRVLVAGGASPVTSYEAHVEVYDPAVNMWTTVPSMTLARQRQVAAVLPDSSVLVAGGGTPFGTTANAERYRYGYLGDTCTTSNDCGGGPCVDGVCCDTPCAAGPCDACSIAAGADVDGTCKLFTGPACDDGNACTQLDTCRSGVCTGDNPVVCSALDACHDAGTCDPTSGLCSQPAKPDGSLCDDQDACTKLDTCQSGVCTGDSPVTCNPLDECHDPGTCDPMTGICSDPAKPDGEACSMGTCSGGVCTGSSSSSSSSGGGTGGAGGQGGAGMGGGGSGGAPSMGGSGGQGGQGSSSSSSSSSSSGSGSYRIGGCGCSVAGDVGGGQGALVAALMALGLASRRRRRDAR